jgi:hypothetical protein
LRRAIPEKKTRRKKTQDQNKTQNKKPKEQQLTLHELFTQKRLESVFSQAICLLWLAFSDVFSILAR